MNYYSDWYLLFSIPVSFHVQINRVVSEVYSTGQSERCNGNVSFGSALLRIRVGPGLTAG
jgi:hypothetical protein